MEDQWPSGRLPDPAQEMGAEEGKDRMTENRRQMTENRGQTLRDQNHRE